MSHSELTIDSSLQQEQIPCVIENKLGQTAYFFRLNFLQPPEFVLALKEKIEVELDGTVILSINVTGNPSPTIQWIYNKQIIDNKKFEQTVTIDYGFYSLIIQNFTWIDVGNYSVIAKNSEEKISSQTQIILKSSRLHVPTSYKNTVSTETMILITTMKSISNCGDDMIRKILVVLRKRYIF